MATETQSELDPSLDQERIAALQKMKRLATGLLILLAVVFAVSFAFQEQYPWLGYVRAASEGGMVGAIADWFAVTALFRYPLGIKIPHTAIIPHRKDSIGESLGTFVEANFLSEPVVRNKLESVQIAQNAGRWLSNPTNSEKVETEISSALVRVVNLASDAQMQEMLEHTFQTYVMEPEWGPTIGKLGQGIVDANGHHSTVDLLVDKLLQWIDANPDAFENMASRRLPTWVPGFLDKVVDDTFYREARKFVASVKHDKNHKLRIAIDDYLKKLTDDLQSDPAMIERVEQAKRKIFDDPQVRQLAGQAWEGIRNALLTALADPSSAVRQTIAQLLVKAGNTLVQDQEVSAKVNDWAIETAVQVVNNYRHSIASVISDTIKQWDPQETTDKIEVMVGKDLQFIRINGTVVGSLAGLVIYSIASALAAVFNAV